MVAEFGAVTAPGFDIIVGGGGDDEGVEGDGGVGELALDVFDDAVELDFGVVETPGVDDALGVDEGEVLVGAVEEPEEEVGVEVAGLGETDADLGEVAEEVELLAGEEVGAAADEGAEVVDEVEFAGVEGGVDRGDGEVLGVGDVDERLVEVRGEGEDAEGAEVARGGGAVLDGGADFLELEAVGVVGGVNGEGVGVDEVAVGGGDGGVTAPRGLVGALAAAVEGVAVLREEGEGDVLPDAGAAGDVAGEFELAGGGGEGVPGGVAEQAFDRGAVDD